IDVEWLREAYRQTNKRSAAGIDGISAAAYGANLAENLQNLHQRLVSGQYKAPPVERVWLDKEDGRKRPIGKPTFEDKIVQRAVVMLLEPIYEQEFYEFSHGFRKGHSPHQALHELREACRQQNINWVVDADVSRFFDELRHDELRGFIKQRVNDGGILRLIGKWLNAGVMEAGNLSYAEKGSPQGGVISPLLANIYLHYVLDEWYEKEVKPRLKGRSFLLRYADDFIIGCELESDARRIMEVLPRRFGRYGLTIHPEKTKLVKFGKPPKKERPGPKNETFEFLGFTHYWAKSRRGYWVIKRKTARKRQRRSIKSLWQWCKENRHLPLDEQYRMLCLKLRGHYQYYGIRSNYRQLEEVQQQVMKGWRYWLNRRSRERDMIWEKFKEVLTIFPLPKPRIIHAI
ncbi:MAG: group II intron reverse transcriptase/maturase, partial [Planctomycetes bacterium]|nr:group II intron reverse transcriptase/maturase [Planctomycetota bacterium]